MTYEDVIKQLALDTSIKAFERSGELGPDLQPYWDVYRQVMKSGGGEAPEAPGTDFLEYLKKLYAEREAAGANQYSEPPAQQAGPRLPKWPFAGRRPEGRTTEEAFGTALERMK